MLIIHLSTEKYNRMILCIQNLLQVTGLRIKITDQYA